MRVLVVAPPFAGHLDRLVPLLRAAQEAGHHVHVLTGHARLPFLEAHGISAGAPPSLPDYALEQLAEGFGRITGRPHAALAQLRANLRLLPGLTSDLCEAITSWNADVLLADSVALMAAPAAARTGVPWITTVASPLSLHTGTGTPAFLGGLRPPNGPVGRLRDAMGCLLHRALRNLVFAGNRRLLPPELARPFRADGSEAIYSPEAILGFGMMELEFPRAWPSAFEMLGPLASAPSLDPPLYLEPAKKRIFATLGTHLPWARTKWRRGLRKLATEQPSWLIVASEGRMDSDAIETGGPPNLRIVQRICYRRDLPRFDAVVHHGGTGIAYSAIAAGLPSLVVPHDFDQFDMAARIGWHGLGVQAGSLRRAGVHLHRLMNGDWPALEHFRKAAARYDPEGRFLAALCRVRARASRASA